MTFENYSQKLKISEKTEFEKITYTAFYLYKFEKQTEIALDDVFSMLQKIDITISNRSRIKTKLKESRRFRKIREEIYTITSNGIKELSDEIDKILDDNEKIETNSCLFDLSLFLGARGYLDKLFRQINNCYYNHCYDACAVLIRRVFEILLIESYKELKIEDQIKDSNGNYAMLEKICNNAKVNLTLNLSRNTKESLDQIRDLGNFAAHKITYNTRKSDIDKTYSSIRTCFEELYYKAGLKK